MDGDAHYEDCRTTPPLSIVIEDNVFLGANVTVKKGVTIGANSIIGMNSVVTHDIPANSWYSMQGYTKNRNETI